MNKFDWIFFDLDGTLVDSLNLMYKVYLDFLKKYNISGTKDEFEKLNGPSLNEIIEYLKKKYKLNFTSKELFDTYLSMIETSYLNVKPFEESTDVLKRLKENQYKLALVTSTPNSIVQQIMKQHDWSKYFSVIVTGDEIKISKPAPDIYNLGISRTRANLKKILVIEDSRKGYESAIKAGLECVLLDKDTNLKSIQMMLA